MPFVPYEQIDSIKSLPDSYLVGEFDEDGRLVTLRSFVDGELLFTQKISYNGKALEEVIKFDKEGKVTQKRVYDKGDINAVVQ